MIYLDNAATTKPDEEAVSLAMKYLSNEYFNPSGLYREGFALQQELKNARSSLIKHIGDDNNFQLIFTSCGSEADNQALFGFGRRGNIVTTMGEHSAIFATSNEIKNRGIADVRFAPLNEDGTVNVEKLLALVDDKTSLVSVIHINNETGAINDINQIAKEVKKKNPRTIFHSDGVQAYGKISYRLSKDIDAYSVSGHKIGGIKGTGFLIKRKNLTLRPFIYGGGQEGGLRSGTENVFGIKLLEFAANNKFKNLEQENIEIERLKNLLWKLLNKDIFIKISNDNSSPYILTVSARGLRGEILLHMANDNGLIIGTGSACSSNSKVRYSRVMQAMNLDKNTADGILRLSLSNKTTEEEIIKAAEIINNISAELKNRMK